MALLPDPTTAASERSSVKNRLTGSRRRGSGINRHRSRTVSKNEFKRQAQGAGASRGGAGPEPLQPAVKHEKLDKRSELSVKPNTQLHPGLCAGGSSKTSGSRYSPPRRTPRPSQVA